MILLSSFEDNLIDNVGDLKSLNQRSLNDLSLPVLLRQKIEDILNIK